MTEPNWRQETARQGTTIAEELLLLMTDASGRLPDMPFGALGIVLAGAALMQLALARRVDTDTRSLLLVSAAPTGDPMLDAVLEQIALTEEAHPTAWWLELLAQRREEFLGLVSRALEARGVLRIEQPRGLLGGAPRYYPADGGGATEAVRLRLAALLRTDEVPDPQDGVLICLADAIGVLPRLLAAEELDRVRPRIAAIEALEEIGRSVTGVAVEVLSAITVALPIV